MENSSCINAANNALPRSVFMGERVFLHLANPARAAVHVRLGSSAGGKLHL